MTNEERAVELLRREYLGWCHRDDMHGDHLWYGCDRCTNIDGVEHEAPDDPFTILHVDECENGEIAAVLAAYDAALQEPDAVYDEAEGLLAVLDAEGFDGDRSAVEYHREKLRAALVQQQAEGTQP